MNPYLTLGVAKGCTRDEVKQAFLIKAQSAHPDRGGDDASFVELRTAYEQILKELDRRSRSVEKTPLRGSRDDRKPTLFYPRIPPQSYPDRLRRFVRSTMRSIREWDWSNFFVLLLLLAFIGTPILIWNSDPEDPERQARVEAWAAKKEEMRRAADKRAQDEGKPVNKKPSTE
jgi:DnaJ domain